MSSELRVEQLRKVFTTTTAQGPALKAAVDDVSFTIAAGEIVVLLGPSGCGKTTTLRCVAGLEHPTSGKIVIGGTVYTDPQGGVLVPPRNRNLGMVFQSYAVWPHMTVRQNVAYPLKSRGVKGAAQDKAVKEALDLVELSTYADRPVTQLSGGQMQRVALARSMVYQPQILLLDEPLSNLDAQLRLRLRDDLRHHPLEDFVQLVVCVLHAVAPQARPDHRLLEQAVELGHDRVDLPDGRLSPTHQVLRDHL